MQITDAGNLQLTLRELKLGTSGLLNGASGLGHFPVRVEMVAKPRLSLSANLAQGGFSCPFCPLLETTGLSQQANRRKYQPIRDIMLR